MSGQTYPKMLDKIADHLIAKAVGNDPQAIAQTPHQLEAGIDPSAVVCQRKVEMS